MKRFNLFFSVALLVGSLSVAAISAEEIKPQALQAAPAQAAPAAAEKPIDLQPAPLDQPISLIPDTLPEPTKKSSSGDDHSKSAAKQLKKIQDDVSADGLRLRIRFREVKNRALQDDRIHAEMETALSAKTDSEKRAALKRYYNALYDRMLKIDASLKTEVDARRKSYLSRYEQHKVRAAGEPAQFDLSE